MTPALCVLLRAGRLFWQTDDGFILGAPFEGAKRWIGEDLRDARIQEVLQRASRCRNESCELRWYWATGCDLQMRRDEG